MKHKSLAAVTMTMLLTLVIITPTFAKTRTDEDIQRARRHDHEVLAVGRLYQTDAVEPAQRAPLQQSQSTDAQWRQERDKLVKQWNLITHRQNPRLDEHLRMEWLAYHHCMWNGDYNWTNYSDPDFLDFLHTSNPELVESLEKSIGM